MRGICYVREKPEDEWLEYNRQRNIIDAIASLTGMQAMFIDKTKTARGTNGGVFYSWKEMWDTYNETHRIVFLDSNSTKTIKKIKHKKNEDVIYCVGGDISGFDDFDLSDKEVYSLGIEGEKHDIVVACIIGVDKFLRDE